MKLVSLEFEGTILLENEKCVEWIIESPKTFLKQLQELINQNDGYDGKFILSNEDTIIDFSKNTMIINDLFDIDINNKKVLSKLYEELKEITYCEKFYIRTNNILSDIYSYITELEDELDYCIEFIEDIDIQSLFKIMNIRYEIKSNNFLENIIEYMKIMNRVFRIKIFFVVNIRSFLEDYEMKILVQELEYQDFQVIFMENSEKECILNLRRYIIDKDLCEIY